MFTPLLPIDIRSIYHGPLPVRMAKCTPDMLAAAMRLREQLQAIGADLVLSDLYRSYDMQFQAHMEFVSGRKTAYSPPPGGSMHEAGRSTSARSAGSPCRSSGLSPSRSIYCRSSRDRTAAWMKPGTSIAAAATSSSTSIIRTATATTLQSPIRQWPPAPSYRLARRSTHLAATCMQATCSLGLFASGTTSVTWTERSARSQRRESSRWGSIRRPHPMTSSPQSRGRISPHPACDHFLHVS